MPHCIEVGDGDCEVLLDVNDRNDGHVDQVGRVSQPGKRFEAFPTEKLIDPT